MPDTSRPSKQPKSVGKTHRTRLARALAADTGVGYQKCLHAVVTVADAGLLPSSLDAEGMDTAVRILSPLVTFAAKRKPSTGDYRTSASSAMPPSTATYPGPGSKWDEIPVGINADGSQATISLSATPHTIICGSTGSGKSVLQRSVLFHLLAHSDKWDIVAIDLKKVEMAWLSKYPQVRKVATELEDAVKLLRWLRGEMLRRYKAMDSVGVNNAGKLPNPPKAIFCMIDDATMLLAPQGDPSSDGQKSDALRVEANALLGELGRMSRASMIHVMAGFQRLSPEILSSEMAANFEGRIAIGRMDLAASLALLGSDAANRLPNVKGRGLARLRSGDLDAFQVYFAEQSWFDEWTTRQQGGTTNTATTTSTGQPRKRLTLLDLIANGSLTNEMACEMAWLVAGRTNTIVVGGAASGKTTTLNALTDAIGHSEYITTVEDTRELQLNPALLAASREVAPATGNQAAGAPGEFALLIRHALRMNPDRLILDEIRDSDSASGLLQAMRTGFDGTMATLHANTANQAINRLDRLAEHSADFTEGEGQALIGDALDIIVVQRTYPDGSRRIHGIYEVPNQPTAPDGNITATPLWEWHQTDTADDGTIIGSHVRHNHVSDDLIRRRRLNHTPRVSINDLHRMTD